MLRSGQLCDVLLILLITVLGAISGLRYRKIGSIPFRKIPGVSAIDEAVQRAAEMGGAVHFTSGFGGLVSDTFAALNILEYLSRKTAEYGVELIVTNSQPQVHVASEAIVREAYFSSGKESLLKPGTVRYLSDTQQAYVSGVWGIMEREKITSNIMMGYFFAESLQLAEAGNRIGAFQVAGTASTPQLPFFVAACDYTLIGEELFAASAYLCPDAVSVASLMGAEAGKVIAIVVMLLGSVAATFGFTGISRLLER